MTSKNLDAMLGASLPPLPEKNGGDPSSTHPDSPTSRRSFRLDRVLPLGLFLGFLLLLVLILGDRLTPGRPLPVATVVTLRADVAPLQSSPGEREDPASQPTPSKAPSSHPANPYEASILFQAAGWIEPDPLPIKATALFGGVVQEVAVLEGQTVKKGDLLATLIEDDAQLALRTAKSRLASLHGESRAHEANIAVAEAEIATLGTNIIVEEQKAALLENRLQRFEKLLPRGGVSEKEATETRLEFAAQKAQV
ncbi:MAG: biotin/lipoyl-binding protein, partial [Verrucomicrobiota bacterium]